MNKAKSYARTAGLKEGQYWQHKRPHEESRYRPPQNGRAEPGWQKNYQCTKRTRTAEMINKKETQGRTITITNRIIIQIWRQNQEVVGPVEKKTI